MRLGKSNIGRNRFVSSRAQIKKQDEAHIFIGFGLHVKPRFFLVHKQKAG